MNFGNSLNLICVLNIWILKMKFKSKSWIGG